MEITKLAAAVAAILTTGQALQAQAAELPGAAGAAGDVEEIIVTAQRREESIQDVPLSVQAFTGETLAEAGVTSVLDLPRLAPNFNAMRGTQTANVRLSIRGVGASSNSAIDPSIGTFIDGVYVPRPGSLFGSMNDIASVEVLRGPQGTLFGRNSTVGAVLLRSVDPQDEFGGSAELTYGNYDEQKFAGTLNVPVGERFAVRVAGLTDSRDGYAHNRFDGRDFATLESDAFRIGATWDITDDVTWTVKYDRSRMQGDGKAELEIDPDTLTDASRARLTLITGGNPPDLDDAFDRKSNQRITGDVDDDQWGLVSNLTWDLANGHTVRLLGGYRSWNNEQLESDVLFMPADFLARTGRFESTSQSYELQLISPQDELLNGRLDYVAGLYYFQEDYFVGEQFGLGAQFCGLVPAAQRPACAASANKANATMLDFDQDAENLAAYAQTDIGLTDAVDLVLGARWTKDDKTGTFVQTVNNPFGALLRAAENTALDLGEDAFTYRVGLNWAPNQDLLVFGSYSTGYKSGGFNSGGGNAALGQRRLFDKETTDNYEVGAKWTLADGRAHLNGTAFLMQLDDFQDRAFDGQSFNVINAGSVRNQGIEIDGDWSPQDWLSLYASVGYLDAEFDEYDNASCLPYPAQVNPTCTQDLAGERPVFAPELQASTGVQVQGDFGGSGVGYMLRTDVAYMDDINVNQINDNNPQGIQPAFTLVSARFSLYFGAAQRYALTFWGDNLTDEDYCTGKVAQPFDNLLGLRDPVSGGTVMRCQVNVPRTYGVSLKASF
ncbi:MAG TPA: TonB-dependent receptor [Steroidobacteraceae bacterium]|nr:TonB-dependent receptor [Steroidobacteraceae bacterium]